ncbi:MAG: DUF883 family protein [Betaproteobacteria bacterium]|nr:DUF883 family protein [Betaproteobacteria bacterium]
MDAPVSPALAKEKLVEDFRAVVSDTEELLRATANQTGERIAAARARAEETLREARVRLEQLQESALERGKAAARQTDQYVHEHPWQAIGISAGVGMLLGMLIGSRR